MEKPLIEKKRLAPLNDAGPTQLLNVQIQKLEQENSALKLRIKTVEGQATEILESKLGLKSELETLRKKIEEEKPKIVVEDNSEELAKLNEKVVAANEELIAEKELSEKSQKELESDLASAKHRLVLYVSFKYLTNSHWLKYFKISRGATSAEYGRKGL